MGTGGIYEIVNTVDGKRYIGSAKNFKQRWRRHHHLLKNGDHHSRHLQFAWDKYGESTFRFIPMMTVEDSTRLIWWEQRFLDALKPEYNVCLTAGSSLGRKHTKETRTKVSALLVGNTYATGGRGRTLSVEHRAAIGDANRGKKRGPQPTELIERRVAPLRGRKQSPEVIAKRVKSRLLNASYKRLMECAWAGA